MEKMQKINQILENIKTDIKNYYIGTAIADKRKELGLSVEETSLYLNINPMELTLLETGEKEITPEILYKLSLLFNVKVSSFFYMLNNF